jgi:hypothetical protein
MPFSNGALCISVLNNIEACKSCRLNNYLSVTASFCQFLPVSASFCRTLNPVLASWVYPCPSHCGEEAVYSLFQQG